GEGAQVRAVQAHRAGGGVDQAGGDQGEGGLARAGGADDSEHAGARLRIGAQAHPVQGVPLTDLRGGVAVLAPEDHFGGVVEVDEGDLVEGEHAGTVGQGVGTVGALVVDVEDLLDPAAADDGAGEVAEHPAEGADRQGHEREQVGDLDQLTGGEVAVADPPGAEHGDREDAEVGQGVDQRVEPAAHVAEADPGLAQVVGGAVEALLLDVLTAQRLHHVRAVEGFVGDLGDLGAQLLGAHRDRGRVALQEHVEDDQQQDQREHDQQDHRVDAGHDHGRVDQHGGGGQRERERRHREEGRLDVGVDGAEQGAGGLAAVPQQRHLRVDGDDPFAVQPEQVELGSGGEDAPRHHGDGAGHGDAEDRQAAAEQQGGGRLPALEGRHDHLLGDAADDRGGGDLQQGEAGRPEHGQDEPAPLLPGALQQALQARAQHGG